MMPKLASHGCSFFAVLFLSFFQTVGLIAYHRQLTESMIPQSSALFNIEYPGRLFDDNTICGGDYGMRPTLSFISDRLSLAVSEDSHFPPLLPVLLINTQPDLNCVPSSIRFSLKPDELCRRHRNHTTGLPISKDDADADIRESSGFRTRSL